MRRRRWSDRKAFSAMCVWRRASRRGHPMRRRSSELVDRALLELSPAFDRVYAREGRPSIPPEPTVASVAAGRRSTRCDRERQLMEQL